MEKDNSEQIKKAQDILKDLRSAKERAIKEIESLDSIIEKSLSLKNALLEELKSLGLENLQEVKEDTTDSSQKEIADAIYPLEEKTNQGKEETVLEVDKINIDTNDQKIINQDITSEELEDDDINSDLDEEFDLWSDDIDPFSENK